MEKLVLEATHAGDWIYRGEGAANLVLAYSGSSPSFVGKVLRVHKVARTDSECETALTALTIHECLLWKEIDDLVLAPTREIAEHLYVQHVMCPLLGSDHVDSGTCVFVAKEFLEAIETNVLSQRPSWRVNDAKANTQCESALLLSDLSVFPRSTLKDEFCISVEIKPKCGFLPASRFIADENYVKRCITRFKMHQALKLHQGKISKISEYDPLDLFSGSLERVNKAMKDLILTPQNNLRVFLNGSLIFGGSGGLSDPTSCLNEELLEDALKCVIRAEDGMRTTNFLHLVAEAVCRPGLLDRLLEVQKFDKLDIEGAIHAYYNVISQPCPICRVFKENKKKLSEKYTSLHSDPLSKSLKIVKDYLIAATAKDLSIMISFRPTEKRVTGSSNDVVSLKSNSQCFEYKASFIDLDMKPLKKMAYYFELDQKIVRHYSQMVKSNIYSERVASIKDTLHHEQISAVEDVSHTRDSSGMASSRTIKDQNSFSGDHSSLTPIASCPQGTLNIGLLTVRSWILYLKTVVSVDLLCSKCRKKVMKLISSIEGINSIVLDPSKNTVTVIGESDPVCIIKQVRKFRSTAQIMSIGPPKVEEKKEEKKEAFPSLPRTCQRCDVWYVVGQDYTPCHIL